MSSERVKYLKDRFISIVESQLGGDLSCVDAKELGEIVDCAKDMAEMLYYCSITDAMEEKDPDEKKYYMKKYVPESRYYSYPMEMEYPQKRLYYDGDTRMRDMDNRRMYYTPLGTNKDHVDYREGRSPMIRKMYMSMQESGADSDKKVQELERYVQELSEDITEMLVNATQEEKATVKQKLTNLASKL